MDEKLNNYVCEENKHDYEDWGKLVNKNGDGDRKPGSSSMYRGGGSDSCQYCGRDTR